MVGLKSRVCKDDGRDSEWYAAVFIGQRKLDQKVCSVDINVVKSKMRYPQVLIADVLC